VDVVSDELKNKRLNACMVELWRAHNWGNVFAPGDAIRLPPFSFVAPDAQYLVHSAFVPVSKREGAQTAVLLNEANTGNGAASMSLVQLRGEGTFHRHASIEIFFVLSGTGTVRSTHGSETLSPGSVVYLGRGLDHAFRADKGLVAVQFLSPWENPKSGASQTRNMHVRKSQDVRRLPIARGMGDVRIVFEYANTGEHAVYVGALTAKVDMEVRPHSHKDSSEYLFVISGSGTMRIAGRSMEARAGDAIQIPPGVLHDLVVESEMKVLQFYTPVGPEQRFKIGAMLR